MESSILTNIVTWPLALVFVFLSAVHVYWALGGNWGLGAVFPQKEGDSTQVFSPPPILTWVVAFGLMGFAALAVLLYLNGSDNSLLQGAGWVASGIFLLRALGDFKYVGFTKRIRGTAFSRMDDRMYAPLCLALSLGFFVLLTF